MHFRGRCFPQKNERFAVVKYSSKGIMMWPREKLNNISELFFWRLMNSEYQSLDDTKN